MKKHIPNLLTILRIALCLPLLFTAPLSLWFIALYLFCGVSDILDGFMARRLDAGSKCGAVLDSVADAVFVFVVLAKLIPVISLPLWAVLWVIVIALIKLVSLAWGYYKFHALAFLHTYANKAAGFLLFCFPLFIGRGTQTAITAVACAVASVAALEELAINIKSGTLTRDVKSIIIKLT